MPSINMLEMWIKNNYNVLFHGRPGVGKTSMVFEAFEKQGWEKNVDFLYFSAATIDPWVDLIGVPSKIVNSDGEEVLKLIRPDTIKNKTIKALFVDELNRSHKKVRNALMELIQFKSINGLRFPNLEIIWAAVNPDEDDELKFDVEKLDLAQEDRFQIHVQIPYKPNEAYFAQKFNDPEMAEAVCKWWYDQPEKVKLQLTPRRLEYAIDVFLKTNDLRFVVPQEAHVPSLKNAIQCGNPEKTLMKMLEAGNEAEIRRWLAVENNLSGVQNLICTNRAVCAKALHLLSDERLVAFAIKNKTVIDQIKAEPQKYERIIRDIAANSTNKILKEVCTKLIPYLDSNSNALKSIFLPRKAQLTVTKRQKAKIFSNYALIDNPDVIHVNNQVEKITHELVAIATECTFANNTLQRSEILQKMGDIVHPNMAAEESETCVKVLDFVFGHIQDLTYLSKFIPVINTCVLSYIRTNKGQTMESMYNLAPNLVVNALVRMCEFKSKFGYDDSKFVVEVCDSNEHIDVPDEVESGRAQQVEDLF
jgi:hypothetical protein